MVYVKFYLGINQGLAAQRLQLCNETWAGKHVLLQTGLDAFFC